VPLSTLISGPGGTGKPLVEFAFVAAWLKAGGSLTAVKLQYPTPELIKTAMYKLEPVVADQGTLIIYDPLIREVSFIHGALIDKVGYHIRDYFLKQTNRFEWAPGTIKAHSTHVKGTGTGMLFIKLLRDAAKLDIWKVVTDYYQRKDGKRNGALELDLPDTPGISSAVYRDLVNRKIVDVRNIKNLNDFKLLQAGWVFDINFKPTLHSIKSRHYLDMIRDVLPGSSEISEVFTVIKNYLEYQINSQNERIR